MQCRIDDQTTFALSTDTIEQIRDAYYNAKQSLAELQRFLGQYGTQSEVAGIGKVKQAMAEVSLEHFWTEV